MPKVWQKYGKSDSLIGLWEISEAEEELIDLADQAIPSELRNPTRRRQWVASRALLRELTLELGLKPSELIKNEHGSPSFKDQHCQVSISHSGNYAAVALNPQQRIGVDVEQVTPRIKKIREKFINDTEVLHLKNDEDLENMYLIWSAKEALFKYHPEPNFDFRSELWIDELESDHLKARIIRNELEESMHVPFHWQEDYVLAWTEKPDRG